jgi:DNA-binding transcriptional LysR family regulator
MGPAEAILPLGHPLAERDRITTADLAGESFVSFRPDSVFRTKVDQIFQRDGVERVMRYEARTMEAVCSLVAAGLGVSIVGPLGSHSRHLIGHRFHIKPFEPRLEVELSMIWSTHRPLPVVVQKFLDLAESQLKADLLQNGTPGRRNS